MAYTRPSASAADTSWQGAASYTRPTANAADASFLTGNQATGFASTAFGTPSFIGLTSSFSTTTFGTGIAGRTQSATGFTTTSVSSPSIPLIATGVAPSAPFGSPGSSLTQRPSGFNCAYFGTPVVLPIAVGFSSTVVSIPSIPLLATGIYNNATFGAPVSALTQRPVGFASTAFGLPANLPIAVGFYSTVFGAPPIGQQYWRAKSAGRLAVVSPAYYAFAQQLPAVSFSPVRFGTPFAFRINAPVISQICRAYSIESTVFSIPAAGSLQLGQASGFTSTALSSVRLARRQATTGFSATSFGAPQTNLTARPLGFAVASTGVPVLLLGLPAVGALHTSRFGLPAASRSNTYLVYGVDRSNFFGYPAGNVRINRTTAGFCSTIVGAPSAYERSRANHIGHATYFGVPRLTRSTTC